MRGMTILLATVLTVGYGYAAQAAMTADRVETIRRVAGPAESLAPTPAEAASRVWYGGMLAPVTVEVSATPALERCALT
ncbi:MAG TPA: hypothetical protein VGQ06_15635 [Gemmatimonadales bacterium]|jgi:hypothetical protein|nr:hypothetical protein [Gemmatimonadales bacterium]